ncbi:MAG: tetratricopeptide repeat protein [Asgard group archaeon]|nr:tetratricopeptide repeat protein [Asgard group archaeon]
MFKSHFKIFHEAEQLLFKGKIDLAFKKVNQLEKDKKLSDEEKIACKILKSNLLFEQGVFNKSQELTEESLKSSQKLKNQSLVIQSLLLKIRNNLQLKKFEECNSLIDQVEQIQKELVQTEKDKFISIQQEAILLNFKGEVSQNKGDLDLAIEYAKSSSKIFEKLNHEYGRAEVFINIAKIYSTKGELDQALEFFQKSLDIWERIDNKRNFAKNLMNVGNIHTDKGELDIALEYFQKSYEICKQINEKQTLANSLGSIGINHAMKGELDKALEYFQQSLEICEQIKDKQILAKNLGSVGIIHHSKGELNKALEYYQQSLEMNKEIGNIDGVVIFLGNIGEIYRLKGELDEALSYYQESLQVYENIGGKSIPMALALVNSGLVYQQKGDSKIALEYFGKGLEIFTDSGNPRRMAEVHFFQISLLIDLNQIEEAKESLKQLQKINEQEENKLVAQMARVSEALLLKTNKRAKNRAKAEELLSKVLEEEVINYEVFLVALINLSELFLIELQLTGDEEALAELKLLMSKQLALAKEQNSYSLLVETYFLQAQLALVELEIKKAQKLLNQSQLIAEEKGLKRLAMKISSDYDYYFEEKEMWEEFTDKKPSISERLSHTSLEETILRMIKKRAVEPPIFIDEEPILLVIVAEVGIPLFSQYFGPETQINDLLIGGFLTAINSFMQEAFATDGSIERIKHQDYTLVLQFKKKLRFCYVFKGPSYGAMNKLSNFIHQLEKPTHSKLVQALIDDKSSQKLSIPHKSSLEKLARQVFLPK